MTGFVLRGHIYCTCEYFLNIYMYVCVFIYTYKYIQYTHIYILCKQTFILDAINQFDSPNNLLN